MVRVAATFRARRWRNKNQTTFRIRVSISNVLIHFPTSKYNLSTVFLQNEIQILKSRKELFLIFEVYFWSKVDRIRKACLGSLEPRQFTLNSTSVATLAMNNALADILHVLSTYAADQLLNYEEVMDGPCILICLSEFR